MTLLEQVLDQIGREYRAQGAGPLYDRLRAALVGTSDTIGYAQIAAECGMTEAAVKKAAQRLRRRYRDLVREQIAATVGDPAEVDDEIRGLFAALSV
jgi:RNA polymerase sigma-70 factor (ECF subfamily)